MLGANVDPNNLPIADFDVLALLTKALNIEWDVLRGLLLGIAEEFVIALLPGVLALRLCARILGEGLY